MIMLFFNADDEGGTFNGILIDDDQGVVVEA